ncbi:hypothetical protein ACFC1R_35540 [Kitasatospora sp. NPDC056138]|uniref:hypothetical protein n=1 Tax=Kitasatospora sp. NPDC056138 TaxID=3345724 RepID=UPI0035D54BFD
MPLLARLRPRRTLELALALTALTVTGAGTATAAEPKPLGVHHETTEFKLFPNTPFLPCLAGNGETPRVKAEVRRGELNDTMDIELRGFKPDLDFDLFTVQRSNQQANGQPVPGFTDFGLAWYQTDLHTDHHGNGRAKIQTILLDQIFGFDPDVSLPPTNTFHVGFWFNRPSDAAACGFTGTTPFNGEHNAGPLAFITRPDATTGLGPLCTKPNTSTRPATCEA